MGTPYGFRPAALLAALCLAFLQPLSATTYRVPELIPSIQQALDYARAGDIIAVAPGEYDLGQPLSFRGKAIALVSEHGPEVTLLRRSSPSVRGSVVVFEDGETRESVLEGFSITGGTGTQMDSLNGGGILCLDGSSPTLRHLRITANSATYGGALYCEESSPILEDCDLSFNHVTCGGGAFLVASAPEFRRCVIRGNKGSYASSGVHSKSGSKPRMESCFIIGNVTYYGGGVDSFQSSPVLTNCVIAGNKAGSGGGAFVANDSSLTLVNCTIAGNTAENDDNMSCYTGQLALRNCIVGGEAPADSNWNIASCIFDADPLWIDAGRFDFTRTRLQPFSGEMLEMPDFVVEEPDFQLRAGSPAIDAGTASGAPAVDIEGTPRPQGSGVDIGAYEFQDSGSRSFLRGDANGDAAQDISDAVFLLRYLFSSGDPSSFQCRKAGDANDDGKIDLSDAVYELAALFQGARPLPEPRASCGVDPTPDALDCYASACNAAP